MNFGDRLPQPQLQPSLNLFQSLSPLVPPAHPPSLQFNSVFQEHSNSFSRKEHEYTIKDVPIGMQISDV